MRELKARSGKIIQDMHSVPISLADLCCETWNQTRPISAGQVSVMYFVERRELSIWEV